MLPLLIRIIPSFSSNFFTSRLHGYVRTCVIIEKIRKEGSGFQENIPAIGRIMNDVNKLRGMVSTQRVTRSELRVTISSLVRRTFI